MLSQYRNFNLETPIYDLNGKIVSQTSFDNIEYPVHFSDIILTEILNVKDINENETDLYFNLAKKIKETPTNVELSNEEIEICKKMLNRTSLIIKGRFNELISESVNESDNENEQN